MTTSLLPYAAAVIAVAAGGTRWWRARHAPSPGVTYLCLAIAVVGVAAALSAPATQAITGSWEPLPNATRLLSNAAACVAAFAVHGLALHLMNDPPVARRRVRRQLVVLVLTIGVLAAMLSAAETTPDPAFVDRFADQFPILVYVAVFTAYIAAAAVRFGMLSGQRARHSRRPWLRRGQRLVQVGSAFACAWAVLKIAAAAYVYGAGHRAPVEGTVSTALSAACVVAVALGTTMSRWGPRVAVPLARLRAWRAYRTIRPLHAELAREFPVDGWADEVRGIEQRLTRTVVDVRDGLLALSPYRSPGGQDGSAAAEAVAIAAALRARRAGVPPSTVPVVAPSGPVDVNAEVAWLCRVSRALGSQHIDTGKRIQ